MKIGGAFPVRFMARDGEDGQSSPYVLFKPDVILFQTNSAGVVTSGQSMSVEMILFVGGERCTISNVAKNSRPSGVSMSAITISGGVASASLSVASGTTEANLSGIVNVTVTGTLNGKTYSVAANFSVGAVKQGEQGVQGLSGAVLRNRGRFTQSELSNFSGDAIVNDQFWIDYISYVPNGGGVSKYRLADWVTEWTPTYYVKNGTTTPTGSPVLPGNTAVWTEFSSLKDISVNFIVANNIASDSASLCEAFIGQTSDGVTDNGNGTLSLTQQVVGWAISRGQIRHTQTGLTLTKDGMLYDPTGLHLKVGGSSYIAKNLLPWAGFPSGCLTLGGTVSVTYKSTEWQGLTPKGECLVAIENTGSSALNYQALTSGRMLLETGRTYTLTLFGAAVSGGASGGQFVNVSVQCYSAASGGTAVAIPCTAQNGFTSTEQGISYTFTMGSANPYVEFQLLFFTPIAASAKIALTGAMLTYGTAFPTMWWAYDQTPIEGELQSELLNTGIDIARHQIVLTADQLICQNNSGTKTAWLDEVGNFTLAGVLNNLVVTINSDNASHYGYTGETGKFWLDPLKCGAMVSYNLDTKIYLPEYLMNGTAPQASISGYRAGTTPVDFTLNELRQCVGKKFYFLDNLGDNKKISFGMANSLISVKSTYYGNSNYIDLSYSNYFSTEQVKKETIYLTRDYSPTVGYKFYIIECKMGLYNGYECIYWEIETTGLRVTQPTS